MGSGPLQWRDGTPKFSRAAGEHPLVIYAAARIRSDGTLQTRYVKPMVLKLLIRTHRNMQFVCSDKRLRNRIRIMG